jgi:hypothetical protein
VICKSLFVPFLFAFVLSVLRITDSDYRFGNFKLFLVTVSIPSLNTTFVTLLQEKVEDNKELICHEKMVIIKGKKT